MNIAHARSLADNPLGPQMKKGRLPAGNHLIATVTGFCQASAIPAITKAAGKKIECPGRIGAVVCTCPCHAYVNEEYVHE